MVIYRGRVFNKIVILGLLLGVAICGFLTPEHTEEHIKRLISERYQLYVINLGTTVNNNPLKAYVISGTDFVKLGIKK